MKIIKHCALVFIVAVVFIAASSDASARHRARFRGGIFFGGPPIVYPGPYYYDYYNPAFAPPAVYGYPYYPRARFGFGINIGGPRGGFGFGFSGRRGWCPPGGPRRPERPERPEGPRRPSE